MIGESTVIVGSATKKNFTHFIDHWDTLLVNHLAFFYLQYSHYLLPMIVFKVY